MNASDPRLGLFDQHKAQLAALEAEFEYGKARELLARLHALDPVDVRSVQRLARNFYKDEDLLPAQRFSQALELLRSIGLEDPQAAIERGVPRESLPETLGLGGAIFKRQWEFGGQLEPLQRALHFYRAGWEFDPTANGGWCGVNAVFLLEVLAARERSTSARTRRQSDQAPETAELVRLNRLARKLRLELKRVLEEVASRPGAEPNRWLHYTLAEVEFGLEDYREARSQLESARRLKLLADERSARAAEWELQTTFKQLVMLGRLQGLPLPSLSQPDSAAWTAWRALAPLLRRTPDAADDDGELLAALGCARGRLGLALSGGGFRASLFHLGVLARLAEVDALRGVEALSTVSGGSIVGAHYYLEVQHLLESRTDAQISREDYIRIVQRVQQRFLCGIQRNLRTRVISNLAKLGRMLLPLGYTRSARIGELYENELFREIGERDERDLDAAVGDGAKFHELPLPMEKLKVRPLASSGSGSPAQLEKFKPKFDNWRRRARVPMLLLNATSLNSGHNWQFTAGSMGEPPGLVDTEVGGNPRHRRLWYWQAPEHKPWYRRTPTRELQQITLGQAVGASACVPGLFEPIELRHLYPGRIVRLVDGGVFDNQGVRALLNEGVNLILCSDACGQMDEQPAPGNGTLAVPMRSFSILSSRVREAEYVNLSDSVKNRALQGVCFVHLKKGLDSQPLDWIGCQDPSKPLVDRKSQTDYGVDKELQRQLSAIRTDLDSFGEVEAYALMLSGYRMIEREFKTLDDEHKREGGVGTWGEFDVHAPRGAWPFLELEFLMSLPPTASDRRREELGRQLEASAALAFKLWRIWKPAQILVAALGTAAVLFGLIWLWEHRGDEFLIEARSYSVGASALAVALALGALAVPIARWLRPTKAMQAYLLKVVLASFGWLAAWAHLLVFDKLYLRRTKLARLMRLG